MDYFESIIATLLEVGELDEVDNTFKNCCWVRKSFKVNLTKEEKRQLNKPSIPRPEIDILAFNFAKNEIIAIEAKSYLDSKGVKLKDLQTEHEVQEGRYKLFTSKNYRSVVFKRLKKDLIKCDLANHNTKIKLGLAAGKVHQGQSEPIRVFMAKKDFWFWSPDDIKSKVKHLAERGYENDPVIITAKILMRDRD